MAHKALGCKRVKAHRQEFVASTLCMATFAMATAQPVPAPRAMDPPPNILLIITDQQRAAMLSCTGNRDVKTPALDSLAARGVRFERAYCANPVCAPSRFSMMTGVMPSRIGMDANDDITNAVPASLLTHSLGAIFRDAGYDTYYGGKLHLPGGGPLGLSGTYGFRRLTPDERGGLAAACAGFLQQPHGRPFLLVASFINPHDICYLAINAQANAIGWNVPNTTVLTEALALPPGMSRAEFFASICPPLPQNFGITEGEPPAVRQNGWLPSRSYVQDNWTEEDWRLHRWAYARLTERVDANIGIVLKALHDSGHEGDTLVVFTSDHGEMDASHHLEHKCMPYEEAIRVPLVVSGPGIPTRAVDRSHWVSTGLDLIPTLCDFAAIPVPSGLKGRSLKPLATGAAVPRWRTNLVVENENSRILRCEGWTYAIYDSGAPRELLLDVEHDPGEMHNLAGDRAYHSVLEQQRARLRAWYQAHGVSLPECFTFP